MLSAPSEGSRTICAWSMIPSHRSGALTDEERACQTRGSQWECRSIRRGPHAENARLPATSGLQDFEAIISIDGNYQETADAARSLPTHVFGSSFRHVSTGSASSAARRTYVLRRRTLLPCGMP